MQARYRTQTLQSEFNRAWYALPWQQNFHFTTDYLVSQPHPRSSKEQVTRSRGELHCVSQLVKTDKCKVAGTTSRIQARRGPAKARFNRPGSACKLKMLGFLFFSFFLASRSRRVPLSSGMWLRLDEFGSEGLEFC